MPRHVLTPEEQLRGIEKGQRNPKTSAAFRASMEARAEQLRRQIEKSKQ
jgi:hypothetical protein